VALGGRRGHHALRGIQAEEGWLADLDQRRVKTLKPVGSNTRVEFYCDCCEVVIGEPKEVVARLLMLSR
jgi:hypothetical protein